MTAELLKCFAHFCAGGLFYLIIEYFVKHIYRFWKRLRNADEIRIAIKLK